MKGISIVSADQQVSMVPIWASPKLKFDLHVESHCLRILVSVFWPIEVIARHTMSVAINWDSRQDALFAYQCGEVHCPWRGKG